VAPGLEAGMTLLMKRLPSRLKRCPTEPKSLDVAIQEVGQLLDVGRVVSVTYDLPKGGPTGTYHLHVSLMLIRVDD
jgi:hypothetical protein